MGKRWRSTLVVVKVIQLTSIQLIYLLNMIDFIKSSINNNTISDILSALGIFVLIAIVFISSEGQWLVRFSWVSCAALAGVYLIGVGMSVYTGFEEE